MPHMRRCQHDIWTASVFSGNTHVATSEGISILINLSHHEFQEVHVYGVGFTTAKTSDTAPGDNVYVAKHGSLWLNQLY